MFMDGISVQDVVIIGWSLSILAILHFGRNFLTSRGSLLIGLRTSAVLLAIILEWPIIGCMLAAVGHFGEIFIKNTYPEFYFTELVVEVLRQKEKKQDFSTPVQKYGKVIFPLGLVILGSLGDQWMLISW